MACKVLKILKIAAMNLALFFPVYSLAEEEKILQEEQMSFEKCLNVVNVSKDKLSITPEISNISNKELVAVFTLSDGILKITCDGNKELVIVSTKIN